MKKVIALVLSLALAISVSTALPLKPFLLLAPPIRTSKYWKPSKMIWPLWAMSLNSL